MWSDECSVERGRGKRDEWVFRTAHQAWNRNMVQTYNCKTNIKVMVWGCFWDTGRTSLYIMDRDFESQKHGYSYLRGGRRSWTTLQSSWAIIYMQHIRLETSVVNLTDWPPYSPDLNLFTGASVTYHTSVWIQEAGSRIQDPKDSVDSVNSYEPVRGQIVD